VDTPTENEGIEGNDIYISPFVPPPFVIFKLYGPPLVLLQISFPGAEPKETEVRFDELFAVIVREKPFVVVWVIGEPV